MKTVLIVAGLIAIGLSSFAQDVITKQNGDEINSKIMEVNVDNIKYKKSDNPEGPLYSIPKSEVFMIKYANGTKDVFAAAKATPAAAPSDSANKKTEKKPGARYANITQFGYAPGIGGFDFSISYPNGMGGYSTYSEHIDNTLKMFRLTTINAAQLNNYFSVGLGLGFHYYFDQGEHAITLPVFLDLRGTILGTQKISPVVFFDVGPSIKIDNADSMDGIIMEPGAGISIPANGTNINFSVSYMMQKVSVPNYDFYTGQSQSSSMTLKFLSFKVGFTF
jgi:hypothetical protein